MKYSFFNTGIPALAALTLAPSLCQAELFQAPYGPGGTWRIYETTDPLDATKTFKAAWEEANSKKDPVTNTVQGHLVSITSAGKQLFVRRSLTRAGGDVWIGLTDRAGVAPGAEESQNFGTEEEANRINGWKFTNGDVYEFRNWGAGEPNNAGAGGAEDAVHFGGGGWNDNQSGFDADDPEPSADSANENNSPPAFRYVIEYSTNSPTPFPGIRHGMVFPPNTTFAIPPNTAGNWSVQEVRGLTMAGNIFDAVTQAAGGEGTKFNVQTPYLDFTDPTSNPNGGPVLTTSPLPYLSHVDGTGDDNVLVVAKTRINITAAGDYTLQVHSDDGFGLRVKGQNWVAADGAGYIDPLDPTTLVFETGTGDSNTRGLLNLAVGQYDVEFVTWEGTGGAFYEVTASTGSRLNAAQAQWLPLGSTATLPAINTLNAVRLKSNATVANANVRDRGRVLPAMRNIIEKAIADGTAISGLRENLELLEGDPGTPQDLEDQSRMPFNNGNDADPPVADNYITKVEGSFTLLADANGNSTVGETIDVTFGLFCDDGASMRVIGQDFTSAGDLTGDGDAVLVDNSGDMTLTADYYTGNTNAFGLIKLKEGETYSFVCYMYEGGGGSNFNLRWELGDFVGGFDGGQAPLRTQAVGPDDVLFLTANAKVTNSNNAFPAPFLPQARSITTEAVAQNVAQTGTSSILLFKEAAAAAGTGSITGGAYTGTATVMPVGAVDNYVTKVNGRIIVDNQNGTAGESLTLTFGVFADDGADFRIVGQDFTSVADQTGDGTAELADISGDLGISADYYTGNTNAFGVITLVEGEYDVEGHHYEGGGGSGYEVWWALGEFTAFNSAAFRPISTDAGIALPGNTGIPLVPAAAVPTGDFAITSFTFNSGTGAYGLTFNSQAGTNYAVEYTIGFQPAGAPASPLKWNTVPSKSSIAGAAGTTTTTGNISELLAPGGQLPDGSKAFFRVRAL